MKTLAVFSEFASSDQGYTVRYLADLYDRVIAETELSALIINVSEYGSTASDAWRNLGIENLPLKEGVATGRLLSLVSGADVVHVVSPFGAAGEICFAMSVYARKAIGVVQLNPVADSLLSTTRLSGAIRHAVTPNSYLADHLKGAIGCPVFRVLPRIAPVFRPPDALARGKFFVLPPCRDSDWSAILAAVPPDTELCILGKTGDRALMEEVGRSAPAEIAIKAELSDEEVCDVLQRALAFVDWPLTKRTGSDLESDITAFCYALEALACGTPTVISGLRSYNRDLRNLSGCSIARTPSELAASLVRQLTQQQSAATDAARIAREMRLVVNSSTQCRLLADAIDCLADST